MENILATMALLGREPEVEIIEKKIASLAQGKGGTILLRSKQEAGQNLLVRTLIAPSSLRVCHGVCQPYPFLAPYAPFLANFPDFFAAWGKQTQDGITATLAGLGSSWFKGAPGIVARRLTRQVSVPPKSDYAPQALHLEFARHLAGQIAPGIIFLEDIHWAETATFKLLSFLIQALADKPILFILTAVPAILDTPDLPIELRGRNIPVIQKLKALQMAGSFHLSGKSRQEFLEDIARLDSVTTIDFQPLPETVLGNSLKKVVGNSLAEGFSRRIVNFSEGNFVFFNQILLYLIDRVLVRQKDRWQLATGAAQELPSHLESVMIANMEKLEPTFIAALKQAALYGMAVPLSLLRQVSGLGDKWEKFLESGIGRGLFQVWAQQEIIFNSHKHRQAILELLTPQDEKTYHIEWAALLTEKQAARARLAYHAKAGGQPQSLEHLFHAGLAAEHIFAYEEAFEFYRDAARLFPETQKIWLEILHKSEQLIAHFDRIGRRYWHKLLPPVNEDEEETPAKAVSGDWKKRLAQTGKEAFLDLRAFVAQVSARLKAHGLKQSWVQQQEQFRKYVQEFMEGVALYRVAALAENRQPIERKYQKRIRRLMYAETPAQWFPVLGPLLIFLAKVGQVDKKAYPQQDILFIGDLILKELIPGRDASYRAFLAKEVYQIAAIPRKSRLSIARSYEKWGNRLAKNCPEKACEYYLAAAFYARESDDFFHAGRILHKMIQFCTKSMEDSTVAKTYQIEALRCLGKVYEKAAAKEKEHQDKQLTYAIQSTSAYRDAVRLLWEMREASWLGIHLMERAFNTCETYLLENEIIVENLKNAKIKRGHKAEEEFTGKILLVADQDNAGAIEALENAALGERIFPDVELTSEAIPRESLKNYPTVIFLATPYASGKKNFLPALRALATFATGKEESPGVGWFIVEWQNHKCFVILGNNPAELYRLTLDFCNDKVLRRYL